MIRFAVIGTGWIAEEFVKGAQLVPGLEFAAVYSRSADRGKAFAEPFGGASVYTNIYDLAKSDFDAVYIASPNSLHYEQSKLMLQSGKHVLCEKPVCVEPEEYSELCELAHKKDLIYSEAIMYLHLPEREALSSALKDIGNITSAHFDFSQLSSKYPALKRGELPNIFNPKFATGCLMDLGIYCVYPALDLFGEPNEIFAHSKFLQTGADGSGTAVFNYDGMQVTLTYSKTGQDRCGSQILGDEGTIVIPSISRLYNMKRIGNDDGEKIISGFKEKHICMSYEAESFYKWIIKKNCRVDYEKSCEAILNANKMLQKIRKKAGIIFG